MPVASADSRSARPDPDDVSVLLVNDDPGILFAMRAVLGDIDAAIVTANSGEQALSRLLKQDFVLILLDIKMAGMDGFETARLIRSRPCSSSTPIIFTTSHRATDIHRSLGLQLGASDYLFMPIAPDILRAKVQVFVDMARRRRLQAAREARAGAGHTGAYPWRVAQCADTERVILQHAGQYVALLDVTGRWLYASASYREQFGSAIQSSGSYLEIVHPDDRERLAESIAQRLPADVHRRIQYRVVGQSERHFESDVNPVCAGSSAPAQLVLVSRDITERKEMEAYVLHQSSHDSLTGLPNRLLLEDRLSQATAHRERQHPNVAVLFIDLDRFKTVNDTLGHAAGDRLLQDVAERLCGCVRDGDTVARLGGDEFVVMLLGLNDAQDAAVVAEKIVARVSATCHIEGSELHVTPSIGIAIFPDDGHDPETLMRNADMAMYHAKRDGGAGFFFFARQMHEAASRKLALGTALQRALALGEFRLHYQPKVSTATGAICGFEALIRWPQPDGAWLPPGLFIPVAEETGRIERIGSWAIQETAAKLRCLREHGFGAVPIAVNMSALQFGRDCVAGTLDDALRAAGVAPSLLEVELTETGVMSNPDKAIDTLRQIQQLGMAVTIDDFGTGYSSLAYLKRLPINKLKIDASFVRDIATDPSDAAIVMAIITLGHVLHLTVIAEGVETAEQVAFLVEHGCDEIQGNYFSAAVSSEDALALLRRGPFSLAPPSAEDKP